MGLAFRPPQYAKTPQLVLHDLFSLAIYSLVPMVVGLVWLEGPIPFAWMSWVALLVVIVAIVSGCLRKWYYRTLARKYTLSSWEALD